MQNEPTMMETLCGTYWHPLNAFVLRRGYDCHQAEDLTQEFFARLLRDKQHWGLGRAGDRCWAYLMAALKKFLSNEWHREHCQKRGGFKVMIPLDDSADGGCAEELVESKTPVTLGDRQWALDLLDRALERLRQEYVVADKELHFAQLKVCLPGAESEVNYGDLAAGLQMSEPASRMAAHRVRRRYGELVRTELGQTLSEHEDIEEEIQHLIAALSRC